MTQRAAEMGGAPRIGDRYEVEASLGKGGMATVFRAKDLLLHRQVAVKVLLENADNDELMLRFHREARSCASLDHPNIVRIFDYSGLGVIPAYIVMQLVEGRTLDRALGDRGPLPEVVLLAIFRSLASALGHAHAAGVIHRDIKPSNVIMSSRGDLMLTDFGLAKSHLQPDPAGGGTTSRVFGTPGYMAAEQYSSAAGPASDMFSLGALIYDLASGVVPFANPNVLARYEDILAGRFRPLGERCPRLSRSLTDAVHLCLAGDPKLRPTAEEMRLHCEEQLEARRAPADATLLARFCDGQDLLRRSVTRPLAAKSAAQAVVRGERPTSGDTTDKVTEPNAKAHPRRPAGTPWPVLALLAVGVIGAAALLAKVLIE